MNFLKKLRATGRTTRMLGHARQLAEAGKKVVVVADNDREERRLRSEFADSSLSVRFITPHDPAFTWDGFRMGLGLRGDPDAILLIDHHTIEERFASILEELHRYDE